MDNKRHVEYLAATNAAIGYEDEEDDFLNIFMTDEEIDEELRQLADDSIMDDWPETEQEVNHL